MDKKWLYSVAVGALLIAGEAYGVTVHEVLSNGFWSADHRGFTPNLMDQELKSGSFVVSMLRRRKTRERHEEDYDAELFGSVFSGKDKINHRKWKEDRTVERVRWKNSSKCEENYFSTIKYTTPSRRQVQSSADLSCKEPGLYETWQVVADYVGKPKKASPLGPYNIPSTPIPNTTTNIVSDSEAYITASAIILVDGQKDCTYTRHIVTGEDVVAITTDCSWRIVKDGKYDINNIQSNYTATFKNGKCKGETEQFSYYYTLTYCNTTNQPIAKVASHSTTFITKDSQNSR